MSKICYIGLTKYKRMFPMKKKTQCFATALPVAILPLLRGFYYHLLQKRKADGTSFVSSHF